MATLPLALALAVALAGPPAKRAPRELFPELTPQKAAELVGQAVVCPGLTVQVVSVRRPPSRPKRDRIAFARLGNGATLWASFDWKLVDVKAWDAWDGNGDPPGGWRLDSFANVGTARETDRLEPDPEVQRAMLELRSNATAVESFAIDHNAYPEGDLTQIVRLLIPTYARRIRLFDPWGEPYRYRAEPDKKQHFVLVSSGADRRYQLSEADLDAILRDDRKWKDEHPMGANASANTDLVFSDGQFLSYVVPLVVFRGTKVGCPPSYAPQGRTP